MKKSIRKNLLVLFVSAICFALVGVFALNINAAFADETVASKENFSLQAGASTRIKGDNLSGIRFKATVKSSYIEELTADGATVEYYMLIAPSKNVSKVTDLTVETIETYDAASIKSTLTPESGKNFDYYAAITYDNTALTAAQLEKAYDVELVARPYIVVTKDGAKSYIYADTTASTARSMRKVAYFALQGMAESKVTYTTAQFNSILSYCNATETKAVLEDNTSSIEFIDGTKYNGAKVYTQSVEDGNVSLTEVGTVSDKAVAFSSSSLAVGETAPLYVLTEDGIIVTYYRAVTKIIKTAQDLRIFDQGSYENGYALVEGYYVLGNDIVDTEYSYNTNGLMAYYNDSNIGGTTATNHKGDTVWYADYGFKGTFDGFGHYVTIKSGAGLFGQIIPVDLANGVYSVIKNVAFKDCELTTSMAGVGGANAYSYTSCLAYGGNFYYLSAMHSARDKKLVEVSNVYISLGSSYYNIPRHDNAGSMTAALISNDINNVEYNNVVVELSDPPTTKHTASPNLFITSEAATMNNNLFNNVYLIGKTTDDSVYGETTQVTVNNNTYNAQLKLSGVLSDLDQNSTPPTNVGLYTDTTAWKTAETDLANKFANDCWTIVDGVPVWAAFVDNSVKIKEKIVFSGYDGDDADNDDVKDQTIYCDEIKGTIQAVYLDTDTLREKNLYIATTGKVNLTNDTNVPVDYKVHIITTKNEYSATLEVYTRVLTSAADLRIFDQGSYTNGFALVEGAFALGNDIVDIEHSYNTQVLYGWTTLASKDSKYYDADYYKNYGFKGTFDGKGHYVSITSGVGLFNQIVPIDYDNGICSVIKNVAFKDCKIARSNDGSANGLYMNTTFLATGENFYLYGNGANNKKLVEISNVYISVGEDYFNKPRHDKMDNTASILMFGDRNNIDYKNVVVELCDPPANHTGSPDLIRSSLAAELSTERFTNVYVIGKTTDATTYGTTTTNNNSWESQIHLTKILSEFDKTASNGAVTTTVPENIDINLYTDTTAWKTAETDLAEKFTSDCWTIVDGVPVWKALAQTAE